MANTIVPFRRRLSVRQAQIAVAIAISIGIVFAIVQILLDARSERQDLGLHAEAIMEYAYKPAARAAYRLDDGGAQEIVHSLLSDPAVVRAELVDDLGLSLARAIRTEEIEKSELAALLLGSEPSVFERVLFVEDEQINVGKLTVELDPVAAAPGFEQRTWNAILSGILKSTILSVFLLVIFQLMITKRVSRLAEDLLDGTLIKRDPNPEGDELDLLEQRVIQSTGALARAVYEAEAANKAKSVFLASMSHEMRTPLNAVIGYAEALEMGIGIENAERRLAYLKSISTAGRQLNTLLGDILDFSKIEAGSVDFNFEDMQISDAIRENQQAIEQILDEHGMSASFSFDTDCRVHADKSRVGQILLNFVTNAAKYGEPGGVVEIGCKAAPGRSSRLYVKDTGEGIPEHQIPTIFDAFVRGNHSLTDVPGAGLGLAICKVLTEGMGGRIECESMPGEGALFWIEFPIVSGQLENHEQPRQSIRS